MECASNNAESFAGLESNATSRKHKNAGLYPILPHRGLYTFGLSFRLSLSEWPLGKIGCGETGKLKCTPTGYPGLCVAYMVALTMRRLIHDRSGVFGALLAAQLLADSWLGLRTLHLRLKDA